jgi:DNA-binding transcriptional MerR regulator
MPATYRIAEAAERSGFVATTLRYYEHIGLVTPCGRTASGYRLYDDSSLALLAFIARAKQLGCTLEEIHDLAEVWRGEECRPVQARLRDLVDAKRVEAHQRATELVTLVSQLDQVADLLRNHTPEGPCDSSCGCADDDPGPVTAITCRLPAAELSARLEAWQSALTAVDQRVAITGGVRLVLRPGAALAPFVDLAVAEQACCPFLSFVFSVDHRGTTVEVRAAYGTGAALTELLGAAA